LPSTIWQAISRSGCHSPDFPDQVSFLFIFARRLANEESVGGCERQDIQRGGWRDGRTGSGVGPGIHRTERGGINGTFSHLTDTYLLIYNTERYEKGLSSELKIKPLDIALSLYEIAGPIFVSLKEEVNSAGKKTCSHPEVKELTFTQLRILFAIEYGKDQVGKLARSAKVAQPAMSKMVDHLISLDLARRDPHPTDRRQIMLSLTPKGAAMTGRVRLKAAEKYVGAITNLSASDRKKLLDGIAVIFDVIEKTRKKDT
jgi:DNA-binding MarR family transcriptional regulator